MMCSMKWFLDRSKIVSQLPDRHAPLPRNREGVSSYVRARQAREISCVAPGTSAGREAAKLRGVRLGRPPALTPDQVALGRRLVDEGTSVRAAIRVLRCHHATLYRALGATADVTRSG